MEERVEVAKVVGWGFVVGDWVVEPGADVGVEVEAGREDEMVLEIQGALWSDQVDVLIYEVVVRGGAGTVDVRVVTGTLGAEEVGELDVLRLELSIVLELDVGRVEEGVELAVTVVT